MSYSPKDNYKYPKPPIRQAMLLEAVPGASHRKLGSVVQLFAQCLQNVEANVPYQISCGDKE